MVYSTSLLLVSFITAAHALNDWSKPCLSGVCSYDIPASAGASGSLKIWGSKDAISDITTAAGWEILGCSPDKLSQDIRLVCKSDDAKAAGCSHLFESVGAEGKIVRLPEACGKNAFARVAKAWVAEDQSIPASVAGRIVRRDGKQPQVRALTIDTNFAAVDAAKVGAVNFAIKGANIKGAAGEIDTSTVGPKRRSRIYGKNSRALFDFVGDAIDGIKSLNEFDVEKSTTLKPLNVNKKFNLFEQELSCPPISASVKVDVDAKANAIASIGVAASGTIIPPKIEDFAVITSLTADLDGSVTLTATASGSLDSGKIKIFEIGVPGLDFPGVLTIGPTFEVNAQAIASLDLEVALTVGLNYQVKKAELIFPPSSKKAQAAGGAFKVGDTPLKLSVSPSVKATGTVEAHLIPSVNLKISALGDIVEAGVFLELDTSATMELSLQAQAEGNVVVGRAAPAIRGRAVTTPVKAPLVKATAKPAPVKAAPAKAAPVKAAPVKAAPAKAAPAKAAPSKAAPSKAAPVKAPAKGAVLAAAAPLGAVAAAPAPAAGPAVVKGGSASFGGCFEIGAGIDVNVGADANFFGLFEAGTSVSLFSRKFEIFKQCFGNAKRSVARPSRLARRAAATLKKRALVCSAANVGAAVQVADQLVRAAAIKTV